MTAEQMREYFGRRYSPANIVLAFAGKGQWEPLVELAEAHCGGWQGGPAARQAMPAHGPAPSAPPPRRGPAADRRRSRRRPPPREPRPVCRPPAGHHPGRPHRLAALLGPDRSRVRRRRRALLSGLQPGRRLLQLPELRAGLDAGEPREGRRGLPGHRCRTVRPRKSWSRPRTRSSRGSVLRSERPMGRLASLGFHWMYHRAYISVEQELEAFRRVTLDDLRRLLADWPLWPMTSSRSGRRRTSGRPPERRS